MIVPISSEPRDETIAQILLHFTDLMVVSEVFQGILNKALHKAFHKALAENKRIGSNIFRVACAHGEFIEVLLAKTSQSWNPKPN